MVAEERGPRTQPRQLRPTGVEGAEASPGALEAGVEPRVADELYDEPRSRIVGPDEEQQDLLRAV